MARGSRRSSARRVVNSAVFTAVVLVILSVSVSVTVNRLDEGAWENYTIEAIKVEQVQFPMRVAGSSLVLR